MEPAESTVAFDIQRDAKRLRAWIRRLRDEHGLPLYTLVEQIRQTRSLYAKPSLSTIRRFMESENYRFYNPTASQLQGVWQYLQNHPVYKEYAPNDKSHEEQIVDRLFASADELFAFALQRFLAESDQVHHRPGFAAMRRMFPGKYVMYRLDLESAARGHTPRQMIRASTVEVEEGRHCIRFSEQQNIAATEGRAAHSQEYRGVISAYGDYMIAIMRSPSHVSFKCLIITKYAPTFNEIPLEEFSGKILVASILASFPSVKFVCRRARGIEKPGLYKFEEIDKDVLNVLVTPTFPGHSIIT